MAEAKVVVEVKPVLSPEGEHRYEAGAKGSEKITLNRLGFEAANVDLDKGTIRDYAVITRGEALGHHLWIDDEFLNQLEAAGNARKLGFKSRFNHPGECTPGFGSFLGRTKEFRRDGDKVLATFTSSKAADPKKLSHLLLMAKHEPDMFGASISFKPDRGAMARFRAEHEDEKGRFKSPDPKNKENYPHARLAEFNASDFVDDPAANPDGLFSANAPDFEAAGTAMLDFVFGLEAEPPESHVFAGIEPARVKGFVRQYLRKRGIQTRKEKETMPEEPKPEERDPRADFTALRKEFDDSDFVAEMFEQNKSLEEAKSIWKDRRIEKLEKDNAALKAAQKKPKDAAPVEHSTQGAEAPVEKGAEKFEKLAAKVAKEKGVTLGEAYSIVSANHPELDDADNF